MGNSFDIERPPERHFTVYKYTALSQIILEGVFKLLKIVKISYNT